MELMDALTVLGELTRRKIVEMVARHGELTAGEIGEQFEASLPATSQHLKVLREADVLRVEKRGRERFYKLNVAAIDEVKKWATRTKEVWDARLDRLDKLLAAKAQAVKKNHTKSPEINYRGNKSLKY